MIQLTSAIKHCLPFQSISDGVRKAEKCTLADGRLWKASLVTIPMWSMEVAIYSLLDDVIIAIIPRDCTFMLFASLTRLPHFHWYTPTGTLTDTSWPPQANSTWHLNWWSHQTANCRIAGTHRFSPRLQTSTGAIWHLFNSSPASSCLTHAAQCHSSCRTNNVLLLQQRNFYHLRLHSKQTRSSPTSNEVYQQHCCQLK